MGAKIADENAAEPMKPKSSGGFRYYRFILLFICVLCLSSICSNYTITNISILCMRTDEVVDPITGNVTHPFDYSQSDISLINGALAAGTIIGTFPVNYLYVKIGARYPFFAAGIISAISTILMPWSASVGLPFLLILRFLQGAAYSSDFAAIGILTVRWSPLGELAIFMAVCTAFTSISAAATNSVTVAFCDSSLGWRWSFYAHAIFGFVVFVLWLFLYRDHPETSRFVSEKERAVIESGKTKAHIEGDSYVPYWEICKNKVVFVIWLNSFVEMSNVVFMLSYAALYMHDILGLSTEMSGMFVAFVSLLHIPVRFLFGFASDKIPYGSAVLKMAIFNTVAVGGPALACAVVGLIGSSSPLFSALTFCAISILIAANPGGFYKCAALTSRQYSHFVVATIQFMKCIALFVAPFIMWLFVPDMKNEAQWRTVFFIYAVVMIVPNFLFYFVVTDQPAAFTLITRESKANLKKLYQENSFATTNSPNDNLNISVY